MPSRLTLSFEDDNDGTGELLAEVRHGKFSGAASAWFGVRQLQEFGAALQATFPLHSEQTLTLEGGFWATSGTPRLSEVHLGLSVYPVGATGVIGVKVDLVTPVHPGERPQSQCSVSVELLTNYEPLRQFGVQIFEIAASGDGLATLVASDA